LTDFKYLYLVQVRADLADQLTAIVVDAILTIRKDDQPIDVFMVEIMQMQHRTYVQQKKERQVYFVVVVLPLDACSVRRDLSYMHAHINMCIVWY
jgi:hypothetical protein